MVMDIFIATGAVLIVLLVAVRFIYRIKNKKCGCSCCKGQCPSCVKYDEKKEL